MTTQAKLHAMSLALHVAIERLALNALRELGLPADRSALNQAIDRMAAESPLWVQTIVLRGQVCQDMYDEHPGLAYFYSDAKEVFEAPPYCPLSRAVEISSKILADAQLLTGHEEECDGLFCPSSIALLDQFGNTVQESSPRNDVVGSQSSEWLTDFPCRSDWPALEIEAKKLDSEGRIESSWDNFDTGRRLHAEAARLRRSIQIAAAQERIVR